MHKIIFVDDEAIIREGITSCVPWEELGFELCAVFDQGQAALDYIREHPVDVVFSDINMPRMNGLELSKVLNRDFPEIKVLLLTGYDDFDYAQQALRNQVREFILKPITRSELSSVLVTVGVELDKEKKKRLQDELLQARLKESFPLLRERYLCRLVSNGASAEALAEQSAWYQWENRKELYQLAVAVLPPDWSEMDRLALVESLSSLLERADEVFFDRRDNLVLLLQGETALQLKDRLKQGADKLFALAASLNKTMLYIGCGEVVDKPALLEASFQGARRAVEYGRSCGLTSVVSIQDIRKRQNSSPEVLDRYTEQIVSCLSEGEVVASVETLKSMRNYLEGCYHSPEELFGIFIRLYSRISHFLQVMNLELESGPWDTLTPVHLDSLEKGEAFFRSLMEEIGTLIRRRRDDTLLSRIDRARSIIKENYKDKNFSLQDICRELYLSTSQFSLLFKEGTGKTFVEYLTALRMEEAKRLLLSTDLKGYEVAEQVGFGDPRYFSISFKKHWGMTAMEYRRTREQ